MDFSVDYLIKKLEMLPHPEGGFYKETYRSADFIPNVEGNQRNISTAISTLLKNHINK